MYELIWFGWAALVEEQERQIREERIRQLMEKGLSYEEAVKIVDQELL